MRRAWLLACAALLSVALTACATADDDSSASSRLPDAMSASAGADAAVHADAAPHPDAQTSADASVVMGNPDAGAGDLFCNDSSTCAAGSCCLLSLCVPGDEPVPGVCLPN
jgi:hypothetical protein